MRWRPHGVVATYGAQLLALRIDQDRVGELVADLQMLVVAQPGLPAWRAALSLAAAHAERPELAAEQLAWFWATGSLRLPADFTWTAVAIVLARAATTIGSATMQTDLITALTPYKERLAWCGSCSYGPIDTALGMLLDALGNQQESRALTLAPAAWPTGSAPSSTGGKPIAACEVWRLLDSC